MSTMHAVLADRYKRRKMALTLLIMALSVLGISFAFSSNAVQIDLIGLSATRATWLGFMSVFVLFLSVTDLVTDWGGKAGSHRDAVQRLARLKALYRGVDLSSYGGRQPPSELSQNYKETMDSLVAIPDRSFNALKARHLRKVEVSKRLSNSVGSPAWVVTATVIREGLKKKQ